MAVGLENNSAVLAEQPDLRTCPYVCLPACAHPCSQHVAQADPCIGCTRLYTHAAELSVLHIPAHMPIRKSKHMQNNWTYACTCTHMRTEMPAQMPAHIHVDMRSTFQSTCLLVRRDTGAL